MNEGKIQIKGKLLKKIEIIITGFLIFVEMGSENV